jgi:hypothetical protein
VVGNLFDKHRLHHNLKTDGIWTSRLLPESDTTAGTSPPANRALEWTTLTGRTYLTRPKDWREGLEPSPARGRPDITASEHSRASAPDDPPPF